MAYYGCSFRDFGGVIGSPYSAYYLEWVKTVYPNTNWGFAVLWSSIVLAIILVVLFVWSFRQIRRGALRD